MITGAAGALGRLVAGHLSARADVVLGTRAPRSPAERRVDFDDPGSLDFSGVRTLLLISAGYGEDDVVTARHGAALAAAERAGVRHVVYTSLSGDGDHQTYALAHRWTERRLREGPLDWTILRNGLYAEFLAAIAAPGPGGTITAPLGAGRLAAVARADLAEAAARVLGEPDRHAGRVYELVGDQPLSGADLAAATGAAYAPVPLAAAREAATAGGALLPYQVPMLLSTYSAIAAGFLDGTAVSRNDLPVLLGRAPASPLAAYTAALPREVRSGPVT